MTSLIGGLGLYGSFNVFVSLFFAIQLMLSDYLGILQESAETFSRKNEPEEFGTTFDYIIGNP